MSKKPEQKPEGKPLKKKAQAAEAEKAARKKSAQVKKKHASSKNATKGKPKKFLEKEAQIERDRQEEIALLDAVIEGKASGKKTEAPKQHPSAAEKLTTNTKPGRGAREKRAVSAESICPQSEKCGACQHIGEPYAKQLKRKDAAVQDLFASIGIHNGNAVFRPILGMDEPFHYRNKVASPFAPGRRQKNKAAKTVLTGMYAAGTHRLVNTDGCAVENCAANSVVKAVRELMERYNMAPYNEDTGAGFMRHVVIRVGHTSGEMLVTLVTNDSEFPASKSFCRDLVSKVPQITTIVQNINMRQTNVILGDSERTLYGPGFILDELCGLSFRISSQSFYQVNAVQTEVLYRTAVSLAGLSGSETAIDAYCGTGTIGLVAAKNGAARVIGVESVESAVRDARQNAKHNGIENAEFVVEDAGKFMRQLAKDRELDPSQTVLFMDPPRAGSSEEFLRSAAAFGPSRIVYISCNPKTQVRDLEILHTLGYRTRIVQPVDMFPHTDHVETVVLLTRDKS